MGAINFGEKYAAARSRLVQSMSDLQWRSCKQLGAIAGNRYGARLREMRRQGYLFEDREIEDGKAYRLVSAVPSSPREKRVRVYLEERDAAALLSGEVSLFARKDVAGALGRFRANKGRL